MGNWASSGFTTSQTPCPKHPKQSPTFSLDCGHNICKTCWQAHIQEQLLEKRKSPLMLTCPSCQTLLPQQAFKELANPACVDYLAELLRTIPEVYPPTEIAHFNYHYNAAGQLRSESGAPFHFINQNHYDALGTFLFLIMISGDVVITELYRQMREDYGLTQVQLPVDAKPNEPTIPIFVSPDFQTASTVVVLLQGSGAVRPGMWARALCLNNDLVHGSIFPYLVACRERGWGAIVLNPNENYSTPPSNWTKADFLTTAKRGASEGPRVRIRGSERPQLHTLYVWDQFIAPASAKQIGMVAHSAGGACTSYLLEARLPALQDRLRVVAFTDAVGVQSPQPAVAAWLAEHAINFVASDQPLGRPFRRPTQVPCVSAGDPRHEWTSATAFSEVFKLLDSRLDRLPAGI